MRRVRWFGTDVWRRPTVSLIIGTFCCCAILLFVWLMIWADTPDSLTAPDPKGARRALAAANVAVPAMLFLMLWLIWRKRLLVQGEDLIVINDVRSFRAPLHSVVGAELGYWSTRFVTVEGQRFPCFAVNSRSLPGTRNCDRTTSIATEIVQRAADLRGEAVLPGAVRLREPLWSRRRNAIMLAVCVAVMVSASSWGPDEPSIGQALIAVGVPTALGLAVELLWPKPDVSRRRALLSTLSGTALIVAAASVLSWSFG